MTINEDSIESGLGFSIRPIRIITKFCIVITSKLTRYKTADKSPMILAQKTVILKYEIAEYNNPLD